MSQKLPIPTFRESLQGLKSIKDEESRIKRINDIVFVIYYQVISQAEIKPDTKFQYPIPHNGRGLKDEFFEKNIPEIIKGLQNLFPDSTIEHTTLTRGHDGKMYDTSKMDEKVKPFINGLPSNDYIIIDWS